MLRPVTITGLGTVHASGCGRDALAAALRDGRSDAQEVDRSDGYHRRSGARLAGLAQAADLRPWLPPAVARRMSTPSRFARVAAQLAYEDAGLDVAADGKAGLRTAVVVSNAFGPSALTEAILRQRRREGPTGVSPSLFTESVSNAPAAQVAIWCRARGKNLTVTQREAGPLLALNEGVHEIASGRADRVLVVAVDEVTPLHHAVLDRFRALARSGPDGVEIARPFDRRRNGFLAAEGAAAVVLEPTSVARTRSRAKARARVRGGGSAFDPGAPAHSWGTDADALAASIVAGLARADLVPADIDLVVSGAAGSVAGDRLEARVLHAVWADAPVPTVVVPKAVTGELGGGHLAGLALAAEGAPFGPTPGFEEPDPACALVPHDGRPMPPPRRVLALALAVGGAAAFTVLERSPSP